MTSVEEQGRPGFVAVDGLDRVGGRPLPEAILWHPDIIAAVDGLPTGSATLRGVPFALGGGQSAPGRPWVGPGSPTLRVALPASAPVHRVAIAHASLPDPEGRLSTGAPSLRVLEPGQHLADYVVEYADGPDSRHAARRRFEVNDVIIDWGELAFAAVPHQVPQPRSWRGPSEPMAWGWDQVGHAAAQFMSARALGRNPAVINPIWWLWSLPVDPTRTPVAVRVEGRGAGYLLLGGVTVALRPGDPFRWTERRAFRVATADQRQPSAISVDLGVVEVPEELRPPYAADWADERVRGLGTPPSRPGDAVAGTLVQVTAAEGATLTVHGSSVALDSVRPDGHAWASPDGSIRIEALRAPDVVTRVRVVDGVTGQPTPARVHMRAADGRYIPPRGHRRDVNDAWFQDFAADLKMGGTPYAYVDGTFDVVLPVGEVDIEVVKGFEFRPERQRIAVDGTVTEHTITLDRAMDLRREGWVTADTHVHFLSPQTAHLEARAEDVHIVNLLAAQWGDLHTNVGDYTGAVSGSSTPDAIVWVGTENRQHLLGHINLLGMSGPPAWPLSASGASEAGIGERTWANLAEWADRCRERDGVVVAPHFPSPLAEIVADVMTGRVDAVELREFQHGIESAGLREWYRLLNCGFRVAAAGGTDKMDAAMPIGGVRTYAKVGDGPLTFARWADAVRRGRTFTTSGPLIDITVDGHGMGSDIPVPPSGATLEVRARVDSIYPVTHLEVVHDGRVVERVTAEGADSLRIDARVRVERSGWLAARAVGPSVAWHGWPVQTAAHTSPIYLSGRAAPREPTDVAFLSAILEGGLTWIDTLAMVPDAAAAARIKGVFEQAREILRSS